VYMVELLLGDSRELDANADSDCEPTFNREQDVTASLAPRDISRADSGACF
jgi:hypothetical protein